MNANDRAAKFMKLIYDRDEMGCDRFAKKYHDFYDVKVSIKYDENWIITPFLVACYIGYETTINRMIEYGADITVLDSLEWNALMLACDSRDREPINVVKILINKYDVNIKNYHGESALTIAYKQLHWKTVEYLIDNNADFATHIDMLTDYHSYNRSSSLEKSVKNMHNHIRDKYRQYIINVINNDQSVDNVIAECFRKTYVPQLVDIIAEFII